MLRSISSTICMFAVSIILISIGYDASSWQWWAILILMALYGLIYTIDD